MASFRTMLLTTKQEDDLNRYWSKFPKYMESQANHMRAANYIEEVLILVKNEPLPGYTCCSKGNQYYSRKDGADISSEDIEALQNHWLGQENVVTQVDAKVIKRYWLCDSSG